MIKMKKQNIIPIIALLALVSMMIVPVSAETLTGTLGGATYSQTTIDVTGTSTSFPNEFTVIKVINLEYSGDTLAMVHFDDVDPTPRNASFSGGAPTYYNTPFNAYLDSDTGVFIVSGTIGYARSFSALGVEQPGYQWLQFNNDWNLTGSGKTGDHYLHLMHTGIYGCTYPWQVSSAAPGNGDMYFIRTGTAGSNVPTGITLRTIDESTMSSYSATKPAGLGISGTVSKSPSGVPYTSKIFIQDSGSNVIVSDGLMNSNNFTFNVPEDQIYIKMLSPSGVWYNSSLLFTPTVPTVTPTPTTTIPAGYVRNNLYIWDQNDAQISGADVDVFDVENAASKYTTADADGWIIIDTLPYHTVNVYAHYPTAGIYLPNEILGLETGYYGGHNWVLVLYPYVTTPSGFVTLYINTRNYDTKAVLTGVNLQIKNLVTGATTGESTGSTDSVSTVVTNATNYQITGSKSGYISKTININSGEASSKTVVIELSKSTVTPTVTGTPLPGEITARPTYAPGCDPAAYDAAVCNRSKDSDMMNQIRDAGPGLIALAIIATVVGLIKLMSKR